MIIDHIIMKPVIGIISRGGVDLKRTVSTKTGTVFAPTGRFQTFWQLWKAEIHALVMVWTEISNSRSAMSKIELECGRVGFGHFPGSTFFSEIPLKTRLRRNISFWYRSPSRFKVFPRDCATQNSDPTFAAKTVPPNIYLPPPSS